jgi:hypothetical protein
MLTWKDNRIGVLLKGQKVWVKDYNPFWMSIDWEPKNLYLRVSCLSKVSPGTVKKSCRLRAAPKRTSLTLSVAKQGLKYNIGKIKQGWATVKVKKGRGYVGRICFLLPQPIANETTLSPQLDDWEDEVKVHSEPLPVEAEQEVAPVPEKEIQTTPPIESSNRKVRVWLGSGISFLKFEKKTNEFDSDLSFQSLKGPNLVLNYEHEINETFQVEGLFIDAKGAISASQVKIEDGSYNWTTWSIKGRYSPPQWKIGLGRSPLRFGVSGGIHYHSQPLLTRTSLSDFRVDNVPITTVSLGPSVKWQGRVFTYVALMHYQLPVAKGSDLEIASSFAFDGLIGMILPRQSWLIGLFWHGQSFDYAYEYQNPVVSLTTGEQSLFSSNVELRLGFQF